MQNAMGVTRPGVRLAIASLALAGVAGAANAAIVADSVADFSTLQGLNGWTYGYYNGNAGESSWTPADFEELEYYRGRGWWARQGNGGYWTTIWAEGMHPNGPGSVSGRMGESHWSVRRWTSDIEGQADISGLLGSRWDFARGDGVTASIFVDGELVFREKLFAGVKDIAYSIKTYLNVGSVVDFAVSPDGGIHYDGTIFTAIVQANVVPAPGALALMGLGGFAAARRRR